MYYYEDHGDLDEKIRILLNHRVIQDISNGQVKRYLMLEQFADYLVGGSAQTG
jgi:hypothetical protein